MLSGLGAACSPAAHGACTRAQLIGARGPFLLPGALRLHDVRRRPGGESRIGEPLPQLRQLTFQRAELRLEAFALLRQVDHAGERYDDCEPSDSTAVAAAWPCGDACPTRTRLQVKRPIAAASSVNTLSSADAGSMIASTMTRSPIP